MEIRKSTRRLPRVVNDTKLSYLAERGKEKINNARAPLLFSSLNILFGGVLVAVVVVVRLSSLVCTTWRTPDSSNNNLKSNTLNCPSTHNQVYKGTTLRSMIASL